MEIRCGPGIALRLRAIPNEFHFQASLLLCYHENKSETRSRFKSDLLSIADGTEIRIISSNSLFLHQQHATPLGGFLHQEAHLRMRGLHVHREPLLQRDVVLCRLPNRASTREGDTPRCYPIRSRHLGERPTGCNIRKAFQRYKG